MGWYCMHKILNNSPRIHFKWFKKIHFKLILLTLLFKFLFFKTNLNCFYVLLINVFSIVTQRGFYKYVLSKKIKSDIFNKSAFADRKLIVIISSVIVRRILPTWSINTKNKLMLYQQQHCFYHYLDRRVRTSTWIFLDMDFFRQTAEPSRVFFYHSQILICLIYLSLPNLYFYTIRSMTMFLKVLNKVNFRALTQT